MPNTTDPWAKFRKPAETTETKDDPWSKYRAPTMIQNTNREDWATLPEPHPNMFADMDDEDAKAYYDAYTRHPDTKTVYDPETRKPILVYKGKPVPPPEGNSPFVSGVTDAIETGLNPLGKLKNFVVENSDYLPDWLSDSGFTRGFAGGTLNVGKNLLESAAAINAAAGPSAIAKGLGMGSELDPAPGLEQKIEDTIPEFNPEGTGQHLGAVTAEIGESLAIGNKLFALGKISGLAPKAAAKFAEYIPSVIQKTAKLLSNAVGSSVGLGLGMDKDSGTLLTGKDSLSNELIGIPILKGLETQGPDEVYNSVNKRLNIILDSWITAALPVEALTKGTKNLAKFTLAKAIINPIKLMVSGNARVRAVAQRVTDMAASITGASKPEEIEAVRKGLIETFQNPDNQFMKHTLGIEGVDDIETRLDPTTIIQRTTRNSQAPEDILLRQKFASERNRVVQEGGGRTAVATEAPDRDLSKLFDQTKEVFGKGNSIKEAAAGVQDSAAMEKAVNEQLSLDATKKSQDVADDIGDKIYGADVLRTKQADAKYAAIPDEAMADEKSFQKVYNDVQDTLPSVIKKIVEKWDGSFKYLNNEVKPAISRAISAKYGKEDISGLQALRENIDVDQMDYLSGNRANTGKFKGKEKEVADAADEAKRYFKEEVGPFRQGPIDDITKIRKYKGAIKPDEAYTESGKIVSNTINNENETPRYFNRMKESLETDEGGRSGKLIDDYKKSAEGAKIFAEKAKNVDKKYSTFFRNGEPTGNSKASFKKMLQDDEALQLVTHAKETVQSNPKINDALKSAYSDLLDESYFPGKQSPFGTGSKVISYAKKDRENLLEIGKEIWSDNPKFLKAVEDLVDTATNSQKSTSVKGSVEGVAKDSEKNAKAASKKIVNFKFGQLNKIATKINIGVDTLLKTLGLKNILHGVEDYAFESGNGMANVLKSLDEKESAESIKNALKFAMAAGTYSSGDENRFESSIRKLNTKEQSDKFLSRRPKSMFKKTEDSVSEQTKKLFYGDESKNPE